MFDAAVKLRGSAVWCIIIAIKISRKYAFSGFEKQLHKNYGTDFHQIWYNGAPYHSTDLRKIWHLSLQKCESRNFSFLFIPLTRTPMFRTAMFSHLRYFDSLVYIRGTFCSSTPLPAVGTRLTSL